MTTEAEVFEQVVKILTPFVKDKEALATVARETHILDDLKVNSSRLVDVVLQLEDRFEIEVGDDDIDSVETVGDCVDLILAKRG